MKLSNGITPEWEFIVRRLEKAMEAVKIYKNSQGYYRVKVRDSWMTFEDITSSKDRRIITFASLDEAKAAIRDYEMVQSRMPIDLDLKHYTNDWEIVDDNR